MIDFLLSATGKGAAPHNASPALSLFAFSALRAVPKIREENPMFSGDLGFRVFKLAGSNFKEWDPDHDKLAETLIESVGRLKSDRAEAGILYELLLKQGLDLSVPIDTRTISGKQVHWIGGRVLLICLAINIAREDVEPLALGIADWRNTFSPAGEVVCVFRDSAFEDGVAKTNIAAILEQNGIRNVRSV